MKVYCPKCNSNSIVAEYTSTVDYEVEVIDNEFVSLGEETGTEIYLGTKFCCGKCKYSTNNDKDLVIK